MKTARLLAWLCALALVPGAAVGGLVLTGSTSDAATTVGAAPTQPTLDAIRAFHRAGSDRIVFQFQGGLPAMHGARYVDRLVADGSGKVIPVPGRAILQVRFGGATAHDNHGLPTAPRRTAYALPNAMLSVRSGDFEGVVTYGIGLAKRTPFHVTTLHNPARVVVRVDAAFQTVQRRLWVFDKQNYVDNSPPFFVPRWRPVIATTPATGLLDRLFAGATPFELNHGLRVLRSEATGFVIRSISDGIARVRLTGGCSSGGSTVTIAGEIMPTLRQLTNVDWVKIYNPAGHTEHPLGHQDSIPACLEP
jgi:hypothetical protein